MRLGLKKWVIKEILEDDYKLVSIYSSVKLHTSLKNLKFETFKRFFKTNDETLTLYTILQIISNYLKTPIGDLLEKIEK